MSEPQQCWETVAVIIPIIPIFCRRENRHKEDNELATRHSPSRWSLGTEPSPFAPHGIGSAGSKSLLHFIAHAIFLQASPLLSLLMIF